MRENELTYNAEQVLENYSTQIDWATRLVLDTLWGPGEWTSHDWSDVRQEATILVVTYHGIMPGWKSNKVADWESTTNGDAEQVRALLASALRLDLMQTIGRQREKEYGTTSLDALVDSGSEPSYTFEDSVIGRVDAEAGIRKRYPTLCLNMLDGYTQAEIAEIRGVTRMTVSRHISREKREFEQEQVRKNVAFLARNGLNVEGDESPEELAEAAQYMTAYLNK